MKTAEEILDKYLANYPWQHWSKENAIKAMEEYRLQSHPSPMSAEQVEENAIPNDIDLLKLKELLMFSDRYEISVQFWPNQVAVYIEKDGVDLKDFGGDADCINDATIYLTRITGGFKNVKQ